MDVIRPVKTRILDYKENPWHVIQWSNATPPGGMETELAVVDSKEALGRIPRDGLAGKMVLTRMDPRGMLRSFAEAGAAGVHLTGERLLGLTGRPLPSGAWVGASCHNTPELMHAVEIDVDFCVLSQVRKKGSAATGGATGQAADYTDDTLGWDGFSGMVRQVPVPVYALGGMRLSDLAHAAPHGAQGIALISDVWDRPGSVAGINRALSR